MPIYEFYCLDCHRIFNFLSHRVNTESIPRCPRCDRPELERRISAFAISKNRPETEEGAAPEVDENRMEQVMESLGQEIEGVDENDPRQMARVMRRLYEAMGQKLGGRVEEAIRRLEGGEDPEAMEDEMGDLFDEENPFPFETDAKSLRRKFLPPSHDDTLYEL